MTSFSRRRARKTRAPKELKATPVDVSGAAVEALVKQTVSESEVQGIPEPSQVRIKRGLEKLKAEVTVKPRGTPSSALSVKRIMLKLVSLAILMIIVPLWLFLTVLVLAVAGVIGFLSLMGPERISGWVVARYKRLQQDDPEKAESLRARAARISARITAFAERLPEKWVQGLYLPDFEPATDLPEKMRTEPFERLSV